MSPRRRAFTFIELMIVALIILILACIAVPNFLEFQVRAKVSRTRVELVGLKMALEAYRLDYRAFPLNRAPSQSDPLDLTVLTTPLAYLSSLPYDTFGPDPRGRHYMYYNAVQVNPAEGLRFVNFDHSMPGYVAGLLWSLGPSRQEGEGGSPFIAIQPEGQVKILVYDPTNGTTSNGNIFQRLP